MEKEKLKSGGGYWESNLELQNDDEEKESLKAKSEESDNLKTTSVGPFMHNLFEKQHYTDVKFCFKNPKGSINAHRAVLAAKCDFFKNLLFGDQKKEAIGMEMKIEISNVPFFVFRDILNYFYTDDINLTDVSTVLDLRTTARSFEIQPLIDRCELYLEMLEITEDNVCSTLQISSTKNAEDLRNRCTDYIKKNTLKVISSPNFEKCSYTTVRDICNLEELNLESELEILEAILRWINVQPDHTKEKLKESLLKCVRFLSFKGEEFCSISQKYPDLLTSVDALNTLMYLNKPTEENLKKLPDWMNKSRRIFSLGIPEAQIDKKGRIRFPLKLSGEHQEVTELTSILQMKCNRGSHEIKSFIFSFEHVSNPGKMAPVLIADFFILPGGLNLGLNKEIDSKEVVLFLDRGIFVRAGQTFHMEVKIKACQSCRFLQYDDLQTGFGNEHFECYIASKPTQGRFFFIKEVKYRPKQRFRPPFPKHHPKERKKL